MPPTAPPLLLNEAENAAIREACSILLQDLSKRYTIPALSRMVGMNRYKLSQGFKQLFGHTVYRYAQEARMLEAMRLLNETSYPIKKISWLTGFNHTDNFITAFKRHFRKTPALVRRKLMLLVSLLAGYDGEWLLMMG
jgi:AraC-like DNA-binding protein